MKMKLTKAWKKRLLGLSILMIGLSILATGTAASYVAVERADNVITTGQLYMELVEETADGLPWVEEDMGAVLPGASVDKVVKVRNNGTVPFFCKLTVTGKVTAQDGSELSFAPVSLDLNTEYWIEKGGAYYYHRLIYPGETTVPLFTQISFDPWMGNEYVQAKVDVTVLGQSVQSANNGTDPLEALGWSEASNVIIRSVEDVTVPDEGM